MLKFQTELEGNNAFVYEIRKQNFLKKNEHFKLTITLIL